MPNLGKIIQCRHCQKVASNCGRGLCNSCYRTFAIRILYPPSNKIASGFDRINETDEQLDAMIEEQQRLDPKWRAFRGPADDPAYNEVVAEREAAGLPARHPDDHR